ncbi:MAG TPA: DNA gyrase subunit A, partial [Candidatus Saccharimonadia bacterium]|nr:DNA gyrase subunit A [Candidatus Saccharimonadia bacterium]
MPKKDDVKPEVNTQVEETQEVVPAVSATPGKAGDNEPVAVAAFVHNQMVQTEFGNMRMTSIVPEMEKSYLDYAMSVIVSRALPDVRDGLKPVHRRILFAMKEMGIHWNSSYKKSARIVGEVLGKFHPHGDTAVYDALVRLAQDFNMRYMLVDGQGNFGSVDGDTAAAMRYTEARLSRLGEELLTDIEKNTVDFIDTFDGSQKEPTVLPSKLPNLLLMGAEGIAVGMATKIPPHNLGEVAAAMQETMKVGRSAQVEKIDSAKLDLQTADPHLLAGKFDSDITIDEIMTHIQGPDFPTGGVIYDWKQIQEGYATGKGRVIIRAVASIEEAKNGSFQIIITQLPYQVNKSKLVAKIAQLVHDKKVIGIRDLRDESDRDGLRVVVDLKKDAKPKSVLNNLFKYTELQTSFPMNMVALNAEGTPQLMNIKTILVDYIQHRLQVVIRRSQFELKAARERAHILEGLLIALAHLDDVIDTIRKSPDSDVAKERLMTKFKLSALQAIAILDMQLRRLAALERQKIEDEYKLLKAIIDELLTLLASPTKLLGVIGKETKEMADLYGDERKTKLHKGKVGEFSEEDLIPNEPTIITITESGYVKRMNPSVYRTQHRGGVGVTGMTTKDEDA